MTLEAKKEEEKKKKFDNDISVYNEKLNDFCQEQWQKLSKEKKWHFWKYFIFIIIAIIFIFTLVSLRDNLFKLMSIQVTENSKLYYAGVIAIVGFIATAIRSFFDTKNILLGLKILTIKKFRNAYKSSNCDNYKIEYKKENEEPTIE